MRKILFSEQQRQRMKRLYLEGASLAQIAMNFGVSIPLIASHLREMEVAIKARGRPERKKQAPPRVLDCDPVPIPEPEIEVVEIFDWT